MKMFTAPIPGQSLTTPPKAYPWERPPEITNPEKAIQAHLDRLSDPEILEAVLDAIELHDLDIHTVTKGIVRGAVAKGIHSIDVGLLVAPVVHEYIKQAAKAFGIPADDGFVDTKAKDKSAKQKLNIRAKRLIANMPVQPKEVVQEIKEEAAPAPEKKKPSKGLMARGDR